MIQPEHSVFRYLVSNVVHSGVNQHGDIDLQIELDSQSVENLAELEIPADIKSKGKLIKFIRKNVEKTLETESETMTHEQFLQNIITYLTIVVLIPPRLEKDNTEEEIEKLYNELKVKQETELQELNARGG